MLQAMIEDMKFNLTPVADVYKDNNPDIEEAIACVEALARVPQQVKKWGYLTTKTIMRNLYQIYYDEVIISLIEKYEMVMGKKYKPILKKSTNIVAFFKKWFIFRKKLTLTPTRYI
jgi:translation initiation factor IF-2